MNSNRFSVSNFENLYLTIHNSDLSDLWLVRKISNGSTSLVLNSEFECTVFKAEFLVEQKPRVFIKVGLNW